MPSSTTPARQDLRFVEADEPIREPITKFGGQPVWLDGPMWPLSAESGRPMRFLGQIRLLGDPVRLAYLFLTENFDEDDVTDTSEPRGGENAFFAQPGEPAEFHRVAGIRSGPTFGPDHRVELTPHPAASEANGADDVNDFASRLWGTPRWLQDEETPDEPGTWRFVLQLDSTDDLPFDVSFGEDGVGYAFLDENTGQGRFCWQCE
ncbi:uncharacterized protein DUF1963 [Halopolyspora algeriensis]|uniref:Uncharacterized protein DUF1963 n=1 Tax=Halopolyspora algeriensis TaxID=1500506 RepID=A0A368VTH6_9ACTN|nr:DUF1963 domain-containing protein [Halopolyspora algeriensis]RCW45069.1 uncharacterized protein DUF1963 [Halopolyspora algeriensis]TQM53206.1 uncharacterized protein DUF1963 [Halopolyspora algeriensis]